MHTQFVVGWPFGRLTDDVIKQRNAFFQNDNAENQHMEKYSNVSNSLSLAGDTVPIAPVSGCHSLQTGNFTGKLAKCAASKPPLEQIAHG
jgi:hypothetical protein